MAFPGLPVLYDVQDAADWTKTIAPFIGQFWEIERVFYGELSPWRYFVTTNPIVSWIHLFLFWVTLSFTLSLVTGNYSWVDRFWSIIPTSYTTLLFVRGYFSGSDINGLLHARFVIVWGMQCLWSVRLTRNYFRKGGYAAGSQDYRWEYVRSRIGTAAFHGLNLVFIAFLQNVLLALLPLPAYVVFLVGKEVPLNWRDALFLEVVLFALVGQLRSDDLQLRYQTSKARHAAGTATFDDTYREFSLPQLDRGFVTAEFWRVSRHPAFFLEQVVWAGFYLWAASTTGVYLNHAILGCLAYVALFQCSTRLTEHISASKYPAYVRYQRTVPMLCPLPFMTWHEAREAKLEREQERERVGGKKEI
ncbi:Steroid oxidoreductase superfamily protein [Taphrina deformans PYCC 5710]|uniref:Steroid oxidoreductase superfamily protein n=1 Tax=Taphrina deformans (strain PYCC 5710 / ATCC 11124 / CBS 356.35 / IMI 108563 / JCM 9778 / NBRC 8474) TaxID=1097556 RepID=R4XCA8_TAPDE|nr:Steroid oxidoreductase superfamily protein [Taphrina deformans PYCC 5710]|eukprot:CCG83210.1 Steroid oxidoreductase superfamily protein [Taphrina deformans PYCC 5710]